MRPTDDSGFACVLAEKMRLTASDWASHLEGLEEIRWDLLSMVIGSLHIVPVSATLTVIHTTKEVSKSLLDIDYHFTNTIMVASRTILLED